MARSPQIVIVGAGMSGLLMGMRLLAAGIDTFTIHEKADRVGGTWRDNTYPGLICDAPAQLYCYADRPNPDWRHRFARGGEIQTYLERVADQTGLRRFIRFGSEMVGAAFRDGRWHIETARGDRLAAEVLIAASGFLHRPRYPDIPGGWEKQMRGWGLGRAGEVSEQSASTRLAALGDSRMQVPTCP